MEEEKLMIRIMTKKETLERDLDDVQQIRTEMIGEIKILETEKGARNKLLTQKHEELESAQSEIYKTQRRYRKSQRNNSG